MTRFLAALALVVASAVSLTAQAMPSIAFSWYAGETAASMASKYRFQVLVANSAGEASIPLALNCTAVPGSCLQLLPSYPTGTTLTVTMQAACAATPMTFGPRSPAVTWTVGTPLPATPIQLPPVSDPCAATAPPPPPPPSQSPNGTTAPPAISITDSWGDIWAVNARRIMRNDAHEDGGYGDLILLFGASEGSTPRIYVKNATYPDANGSWWLHDRTKPLGQRWSQVAGDPRTPAPPPPPPPNQPPTVSMTAPLDGVTLVAPIAVTLAANAGDVDGAIVKVEFRGGAGTVFTDTAAPYEAPWGTSLPGIYSWTPVAFDDDGATTSGAPVTVTVVQPPPPPQEVCGDGVDNDKDGQIDEGCAPTLLPAPVVSGGISECRFVVTGTKPDSTSGWWAQFRVNGANVGSVDKSPPYERTIRKAPGAYTWDIVWSKSGWTSAQARESAGTQTLVCGQP